MNSKKIKVILSTIITLILLTTFSYAKVDKTQIVGETSELYKEWQTLSEEEKQNTLQPAITSLNAEDSVRKSVFNKITSVGAGNTDLPSSYALTNDISVNLKNQSGRNICWAFATTTAIETNVAKVRNRELVLSANHIDYATTRDFSDGTNTKGYNRPLGYGNFKVALGYITSGKGPVYEEDMPFTNSTETLALEQIDIDPVLKVNNYRYFADIYKQYSNGTVTYTNGGSKIYSENDVEGMRDLIKEHIYNYGAVTAYTYLDSSNLYSCINADGEVATYFNDDNSKDANHAITIIGWNDEFPKENFKSGKQPSKDGAYLVVNTAFGSDDKLRLLAVSYEDILIEYQNYGIMSTSSIDYDNIYQYDEYGSNASLNLLDDDTLEPVDVVYIANVFDNNKKDGKYEYINEVSIYVPVTTNVDIYVNPSDDNKNTLQKSASAGILDPGYYTIKLSTPLKLTGDKFVVAAKLQAEDVEYGVEANLRSNGSTTSNEWDYATSNKGESFVSDDGNTWIDLTNIMLGGENLKDTNVCLKAFTTYQDVPQTVSVESISLDKSNIELKIKESETLVASITPSNASNKNIIWESSNTDVATVSNGVVTAKGEGKATITAKTEDGNKIAMCKVNVSGDIPQEDEVYYQEDATNGSSGSNSATATDTTRAVGTIPQTGLNILKIAGLSILILTLIAIIIVRVRKYKDVK